MPILSDTQQPLSADHPIWVAWRSWLHSEEGEVHRNLARAPMFIDSSLWCAFEDGGWECYGLGQGDPHFRVCAVCHNPNGYPSP